MYEKNKRCENRSDEGLTMKKNTIFTAKREENYEQAGFSATWRKCLE